MRQGEQVSRYEVNRNVRMILTRHEADLARVDFSFMGSTVYLYGDLTKTDGEFAAKAVEYIAREISALPHVRDVQFNLNNWTVSPSGDSWQINRTVKAATDKGKVYQTATADSTVVINRAEDLSDVMEEINAKTTKEDEKNKSGN